MEAAWPAVEAVGMGWPYPTAWCLQLLQVPEPRRPLSIQGSHHSRRGKSGPANVGAVGVDRFRLPVVNTAHVCRNTRKLLRELPPEFTCSRLACHS